MTFLPCGYSVEAGTDVVDVAMRTEKQMEMGSSLRDKKSTLADATGLLRHTLLHMIYFAL